MTPAATLVAYSGPAAGRPGEVRLLARPSDFRTTAWRLDQVAVSTSPRTTIREQSEWCNSCWLTEPRARLTIPPLPREPITMSWASREATVSAWAAVTHASLVVTSTLG
jgi:hypothetical protein